MAGCSVATRLGSGSWLPTFQQLSEGLGARRGDREGQLVHGDSVSYGQRVDLSVRDLAGQQLPQQHPETAMSPKR